MHDIDTDEAAGLQDEAVAIIGMAGRFPGAPTLAQFWANIAAGVESITAVSEDRRADAHDQTARTWRVHAGGVIDDIDLFDADFFAVPPGEARWMDPQHRLFLECAWHALEDAGCDPSRLTRTVSVYAGTNMNSYLPARLDQLMGADRAQFMQILVGNEKDFLATRVSYKLNLRGESITVQTSCSTSLVCVHLACQSLLSGQSDLALAGAVSVRIPQLAGYTYEAGMIASPDGHCRPFDHRAQGTVPGNGVGVVVLKRLSDAIADRDHVHAIVKGSWINNDGRAKVGFTAPAVEGQTDVVAKALAMAGVSADSIRFVETHGTGTAIGDPIEIESLTRAFRQTTKRRGFCALGAVKASIGHLDTAAGLAGLIKTSLALRHRLIPPASYFERPNPAIDFESSPFYVSPRPEPWEDGPDPRRAGLSSFGVGGTNVHIVLEEPPPRTRTAPARPVQIVTLSARTTAARAAAVERLTQAIDADPSLDLRDVAHTLNVGRQSFALRKFAVAEDRSQLAQALADARFTSDARGAKPSVVFLFTGQGAQTLGMARALYDGEPVFRDAMDACCRRADARLGRRLADVIYQARGVEADALLARPEFALPALFAVEHALGELWKSWGVTPRAVIGHSFGELVAASFAGVFTRDEAVDLAVERGRLMQRMPEGRMLAVPLSEADAAPFLRADVSLASINAAERCVLTGETSAIERVERELAARGVRGQRLNVPFAYHSALLDPFLEDYAALIARTTRRAPAIPCISNLTGNWLSDADAQEPAYWTRQMRQPVRFAAGLERLRKDGHTCFIEIGPGSTLSSLARQVLGRDVTIGASLAGRDDERADWRACLEAAGRLWLAGVPVDWAAVERTQEGWTIPLPGYAFERQRHWVEQTQPPAVAAEPEANAPAGADVVPSLQQTMPQRAMQQQAPLAAAETPVAVASGEGEPQGSVEERLLAIWRDVLGRATVDPRDNFLELGGDSLTAIRILSRIDSSMGVAVPVEQILSAPTVADLARTIEASIARANATPSTATPAAAATSSRQTDAGVGHPLSYAQEWLWTLNDLTPNSPAYHLPLAVRLRGPFEPRAFERALADVVQRQESLRTVFVPNGDRAAAVVRAPEPVSIPIVDLSACPEDRRLALARRAVAAEVARLFDWSRSAPWRACVVRLDERDHVALFVLHHIISDGWSMGLLVNEVTSIYLARQTGQPAVLPPLPLQYREFAVRQRHGLDADGASLVSFWKRQLADVPPLLTLSARPRPPMRSHRGGRRVFAIDAAIVDGLTDVARREQATLFMALLAGYQALLFRLTGQEDFCVGAPTAGRLQADIEPLIGCFINTLPMRANLAGNPTYVDLLRRVRQTVLDAFAHQALPFGRLVHELRPPRTRSYTPIFQVLFDFNSTPQPRAPEQADLTVEPFGTPMPTAKADLIMDLWRGGGDGLLGALEYDLALFDDQDIDALVAGFQTLLAAAAAEPGRRVTTFAVESAEKREQRATVQRERDSARRDRLLTIKGGARRPVRVNVPDA